MLPGREGGCCNQMVLDVKERRVLCRHDMESRGEEEGVEGGVERVCESQERME